MLKDIIERIIIDMKFKTGDIEILIFLKDIIMTLTYEPPIIS